MRLVEFIQANTKKIAEEWEAFAGSCTPVGSAMSRRVLRDHVEEILTAVTLTMREPRSPEEQADPCLDLAGREHAHQRVDIGFHLDEAVSEFRALRANVVRLWEEGSPEPAASDRGDVIRFNEAIDQILTESMNAYTGKRDRDRQQFLAILGHDLRNPLSAILMSAEIIRRAECPEPRHAESAARILKSAERMSRLLSDVLDMTRFRLGARLPLKPAPMDLGATCRHVVDELAVSHPERALRLASSGDLHGVWDGDRLAQVVSNLVANALQHGDEAAPVVVSAWAEGDRAALSVHNEGRPIPPEDMGKIFEPLIQSEAPGHAGATASLGLGLFIVDQIVTAHGGEVTVTSTEEQGTTFTVRLPRTPPPGAGPPS